MAQAVGPFGVAGLASHPRDAAHRVSQPLHRGLPMGVVVLVVRSRRAPHHRAPFAGRRTNLAPSVAPGKPALNQQEAGKTGRWGRVFVCKAMLVGRLESPGSRWRCTSMHAAMTRPSHPRTFLSSCFPVDPKPWSRWLVGWFGVRQHEYEVLIIAVRRFFHGDEVSIGDGHSRAVFQRVHLGAVHVGR